MRSRVRIYVPMKVALLCVFLQACDQKSADKPREAGRGIPRAADAGVGIPSPALSQYQLEQAKLQGVPATFKNGEGFRFVLIPGGDFRMGSPPAEIGRDEAEGLRYTMLTKSFYMSVCEVSNSQYRRFKPGHESGSVKLLDGEVVQLGADRLPVVNVSSNEAEEFSRWLSTMDNEYDYRLPTSAEWEYACRAGTRTARYWGDGVENARTYENVSTKRAMHRLGGMEEPLPGSSDHLGAREIGQLNPNPWGLFDMLGNVAEWVSDWSNAWPETPTPQDRVELSRSVDPIGVSPVGKTKRIVRGGSWGTTAEFVRCASGRTFPHDAKDRFCGFRLVAMPKAR